MASYFLGFLTLIFMVTALLQQGLCAVLDERFVNKGYLNNVTSRPAEVSDTNTTHIGSAGDFPVCHDLEGPIAPLCLPLNGANVLVDAIYYVTWNADFYPLNATITIEMRYLNSSEGDSAYTSERTDNSYGYLPLGMSKEWLQDKPYNDLTLYIIELDPTSGRRASARQGPTIRLHPKPVEHYRPSPPLPYNRLALFVGLPVSLGAIILVVGGLYFGMRDSRRIKVERLRIAREKAYGIGESKMERLGAMTERDISTDLYSPGEYSGLFYDVLPEMVNSDLLSEFERTAGHVFRRDISKLKSWSG
ncbi:hypothetical protein ASPZODRAFT_145186 [Penicilliopsis zonata CBS 506.65]|uniref:Uncharacterized protein n=1 Tax=Penicilliopsis zonata CBS 506.65 TaxID=1073090 RepID=A0A1L9SA56_9EURO|nr:hypothetical protein ASPZODRAFT_145186 [Penicilliopsis zonata CBS 506.65]OJJ44062.1 hypothetical protein ASPZODRAFT_145186 [Penicilliopsis zonata CBS 506.65]